MSSTTDNTRNNNESTLNEIENNNNSHNNHHARANVDNNEEVDSDYNSMFGDDSDDDEEEMFGSSSNSSDHDNHNINKHNSDEKEDGNCLKVKNERETNSNQIISQKIINTNNIYLSSRQNNTTSTTMKIPKKRQRLLSSPIESSSTTPKFKTHTDNIDYRTISENTDTTIVPSFDIDSYNDYQETFSIDEDDDEVVENDHNYDNGMMSSSSTATQPSHHTTATTKYKHYSSSSQKPSLKLLEPNQYPKFDFNTFMRIMRSWDFIHDLNQSMKKGSTQALDEDDNNNYYGNDNKHTSKQKLHQQEQQQKQLLPLPDEFHCHEQYTALWSPLLINEIKSQILSDLTSSKSQQQIPLSKMVQAVKAVVKLPSGCRSRDENYNDYLTLHISVPSSYTAHSFVSSSSLCNSRSHKVAQNQLLRSEFMQNDLVLLITEPSFLDQACKGILKVDESSSGSNKTTYCMMTLLSNASPLVKNRLGIIGVVTQRSKNLQSGLIVQISDSLLKNNVGNEFDICLLRLGHCVTGLRELKALFTIYEMPLMKYVLSANEQHDPTLSLETYKKALRDNPLSEHGGQNALGIGFRIWVKSKFNISQQQAITAAAREYGSGGFTLVKGPPGTGKTTTLAAMVNALHLRQYQRYYSAVEKITLSFKSMSKKGNTTETLAAIAASAKVKPRILICAPSNAAVDNIILKIMEEQFTDGNGGKYRPSLVRVGAGYTSSVSKVALDHKVNEIIAEGSKPQALEENIQGLQKDLRALEKEIENLQRRIRLIANASSYSLSRDWEIRIDEDNFQAKQRVLFVNHKLKKVELKCPPPPKDGEEVYPTNEMPHYRSCMASLVKFVERHNDNHCKLMQKVLVQNAAQTQDTSNYNQVSTDLHQELETHVLNTTHIVFTTLGSAGSKTMENVKKFSVIVIDEAAQCSEPMMLPALQLGSSHCVLVGDPQQLPATIFSMSGRETKYDRSLFQRLEEAGHRVNMLNVQYRMNPKISAFPRNIFYDGSLLDGPNVSQSNYGGELSQAISKAYRFFQPLMILDLDSFEEREGTSLSNMDEARLVLHLFSSLDTDTHGLSKKSRVAVITPYFQQVVILKRLFEERYGLSYTRFVDISTIDSFQGKEANVVILSCVRAASRGVGIGFLSDVQRMNVALTRAKHFLFVVTRCRTILVNPFWRDFVAHARKQNAIIRIVPKQKMPQKSSSKDSKKRVMNVSVDRLFPNLRFIKPIHFQNAFEGGNSFPEENDGNISA